MGGEDDRWWVFGCGAWATWAKRLYLVVFVARVGAAVPVVADCLAWVIIGSDVCCVYWRPSKVKSESSARGGAMTTTLDGNLDGGLFSPWSVWASMTTFV